MLESESADELVRRVRGGEEEAAVELVRRYEPIIRRQVRVWLRMQDPRLRRIFDSMDVCQSVLASFFVRVAHGQYDLEKPDQLAGLLVGIARHKLLHEVERHQSVKRDVRRDRAEVTEASVEPSIASPDPSPSRYAYGKELLAEFRRRLSSEERQLAERRGDGQGWVAIASDLGGTPEARRKQLTRALDRVSRELGIDSGDLDF